MNPVETAATPPRLSEPGRWVEERGDNWFNIALVRIRSFMLAATHLGIRVLPDNAENGLERGWVPVLQRAFDMPFLKSLTASLQTGLRILLPTCRQASRLQSDALDHPLPLPKRFGLRVHLLLCKWCRRYGKQIRFLRHAAHEHPDELSEAALHSLSPEARERIKGSLRSKAE